ncbi:hypothetical protein BDW22DRAFT_1363253 [Trametopsis cervina]|nr:hypothetical protein BDW22DRAFT_1363253 [Trametopsis cervina]
MINASERQSLVSIDAPLPSYSVLLLINILTVLVDNIPLLSNLLISNPLQESIAPILICRFMMNLRDISSNERTSEHGRTWSSIHFVGNMGQTLRAPGEEEDEEWDDELSRDQEERQEGSSSPSAIQSGPSDREVGAEALQTTSRPQSVEGVVNEGI